MPHGIIALVFRCKIAGGHLVTNDKVTAFHRADQADIRQFTSDAYAVRLLDALCERTAPPPASTTEPSCSTETPHAPAALPNLAVFDQGGPSCGQAIQRTAAFLGAQVSSSRSPRVKGGPLGPSPRRSALADPGPGAHSQVDQRLSRKTGAEQARAITARRESTVRDLSPPAA